MAGEQPSPVSIREQATSERQQMNDRATPLPEHIVRQKLPPFIKRVQQTTSESGKPSVAKTDKKLQLKEEFADPTEKKEFTPIKRDNPSLHLYEYPPIVDGVEREDLVLEQAGNKQMYDFTPFEDYDKETREKVAELHELEDIGDEAGKFDTGHDEMELKENLERVNTIVAKEKQRRVREMQKQLRQQETPGRGEIQKAAELYGHRGMRVPQDMAEIARRKGRPTVSTSTAYARRFEQLARSQGYVPPRDLEIPEEERPPQPQPSEPQEHEGLLNRILRRRQTPQQPAPPVTPPPEPSVVTPPSETPPIPTTPPIVRGRGTPLSPPEPPATPPVAIAEQRKGIKEKLKDIKETLTPKEKLLKAPVKTNIHLADVNEGKPLQELLTEAGSSPDEKEELVRSEIDNMSPQTAIDSLGLTGIVKPQDISMIVAGIDDPPGIDPDKLTYLFDAYHLKTVLGAKLYPSAYDKAKQLLEKKYKNSVETFNKIGGIIQNEHLLETFLQRVSQLEYSSSIAAAVDGATLIPPQLMKGRYRSSVAAEIYQDLAQRKPPVLPDGMKQEDILAAISVAETYQKVADQIYAEAKKEFERLHTPAPAPPPSEPADEATEHGKTLIEDTEKDWDELYKEFLEQRQEYYEAIMDGEADLEAKKTVYEDKQTELRKRWQEDNKADFTNIFTDYSKISPEKKAQAGALLTELATLPEERPHIYLKKLADVVHVILRDPDLSTHPKLRQDINGLYKSVVMFAENVSDGRILDESDTQGNITLEQIYQKYGHLTALNQDRHDIEMDQWNNYRVVAFDEVGLYPQQNKHIELKKAFDAQTAVVVCEPIPRKPPTSEHKIESYEKAMQAVREAREPFYQIYKDRDGQPPQEAAKLHDAYDAAQKEAFTAWIEENKGLLTESYKKYSDLGFASLTPEAFITGLQTLPQEYGDLRFNISAQHALNRLVTARITLHRHLSIANGNNIKEAMRKVDGEILTMFDTMRDSLEQISDDRIVYQELVGQELGAIAKNYGSVAVVKDGAIYYDSRNWDQKQIVEVVSSVGIYQKVENRAIPIPFTEVSAVVQLKPPSEDSLEKVYGAIVGSDSAKDQALRELVASGRATEAEMQLVNEHLEALRLAKPLDADEARSRNPLRKQAFAQYEKLQEAVAPALEALGVHEEDQELIAGQLYALLAARGEKFEGDIEVTDEMKRILYILKTAKL